MEETLKYRLFALLVDSQPKAHDVIDVLYSWADRVLPMHSHTLINIVDKTPFTYEELGILKETMLHGKEKHERAYFRRGVTEYSQNASDIEDMMVDMLEQTNCSDNLFKVNRELTGQVIPYRRPEQYEMQHAVNQ